MWRHCDVMGIYINWTVFMSTRRQCVWVISRRMENGNIKVIHHPRVLVQEKAHLHRNWRIHWNPYFHILNSLVPMVLLAFLSAMVFKLPPDSGEKMGFSLTVLLAYAVYLTIISDDMPSTSTSTSVLCKFCGILYISDLILKSYVCTRFYWSYFL